jgi:hypothetical protein
MGGSSQHSTMPGTHGTNRTQPGRVKMVANGLNRDDHHNHHCVAWSMALPLYWSPVWPIPTTQEAMGSVVASQNPRDH